MIDIQLDDFMKHFSQLINHIASVSPKREAGAGLGVSMLRGRGFPQIRIVCSKFQNVFVFLFLGNLTLGGCQIVG